MGEEIPVLFLSAPIREIRGPTPHFLGVLASWRFNPSFLICLRRCRAGLIRGSIFFQRRESKHGCCKDPVDSARDRADRAGRRDANPTRPAETDGAGSGRGMGILPRPAVAGGLA